MVIIATREEQDWLFDALGAAGLCHGCPAQPYCNQTDEAEEAAGVPVEDRISCGEMQRAAIQVVTTTFTASLEGVRNAKRKRDLQHGLPGRPASD